MPPPPPPSNPSHTYHQPPPRTRPEPAAAPIHAPHPPRHRHTDGLLDNLALDEIAELVERDASRGAPALARRLAAVARARRLRPDDITVVAVVLDERGSTVDASSVAAWGAVGLLGLAAASALQLDAW